MAEGKECEGHLLFSVSSFVVSEGCTLCVYITIPKIVEEIKYLKVTL